MCDWDVFLLLRKEGGEKEKNVTFDVQIIKQVLFLLWSELATRHDLVACDLDKVKLVD